MDGTRKRARTARRGVAAGCLVASGFLVGGVPAYADPPVQEGPFVDVFDDVNPCTGLDHTVTISVTYSVHLHDGREVGTGRSTLSTSSGFTGQGRSSFVDNGEVLRGQFLDMLTNAEGDRIQARGVFVLDLSTDTVRVDSFDLICVGT
jgi:hypothetical protein